MEQLVTPDLFNIYKKISSDSNGQYLLTVSTLRLPEKAGSLVFNHLPSTGQVLLDGIPVVENETEISKTQISSGLLVWDVGSPGLDILLDTNYFVYDTDGILISLLQVYYPLDIVEDIFVNIVDGGNFKTGEDGQGSDTDAGDFDIGDTVINGYSYDGGNFDTGERVGIAPPPATFTNVFLDGGLDPETQSNMALLDENFEIIPTAQLPNAQFFAPSVIDTDMSLDLDFTLEFELAYASRYFEGFDYGAIVPDFGYDIDYGSIDTANIEAYDFNSIENYIEPVPANAVT